MQEEEVVQVSCWIDNIDRNKIPYIKEDDWRYSYPSLTPLNITKEEKENLFDISNVLFWAMHKTVKSVRHVNDLFGNLSFIGSKFDCISNLSRMDFVKDMNGDFRLIEINSDTPCAIPETFYGNFRFKSKEISLKELLYEQLLQLSQKTIILYQAENYIYCLMESVSGLSDLLSNCLKHIRELHNQSVKVGISNPFQDISYTQHASTQAKRRLSAGYRIDGVYVFTHTYSSRAVRSLISIQDLDNLQRALLSGNGQNADRILETIHQTISHSEQNSVELRQMFFSLRSVYATVCNQFSLEAERNGETRYHAPILPNDLDEYDLDSVYEVFRSLNIELQQQYEIVMARTARSLGTDILAYIDQNYTDPNLCAGVIADVFHISEKYVFQLLKSCCNETLNDRILRLRIDEGIRLLTTTDLTITTIAKKTGFSSSNTMYKAFMRVKGISPSSYRGKEI